MFTFIVFERRLMQCCNQSGDVVYGAVECIALYSLGFHFLHSVSEMRVSCIRKYSLICITI